MTGYIKLETIGKMGDMISYLEQQNKLLQKKLEIATTALNKIDPENVPFKDFHHRGAILWGIARKALKEMEEQ